MVSTMAKHKPMLTFGTVPDLDMFSKYMDGAWEKQPLLEKYRLGKHGSDSLGEKL